jgi:DNA-binding transcriptional regulator YhcF (GntR family)
VIASQPKRKGKKGKKNEVENLARFVLRKGTSMGFEPQEIKDCFEKIIEEESS